MHLIEKSIIKKQYQNKFCVLKDL